MTNKRTTRHALLTSLLSLLLCVSMLVGTTFAWFTDSVTSGQNKIIAGNLDIELYHSDKAVTGEKVTETTKLFDDITLWEPGVVAWENLNVANKGTLALKYELSVNFENATETPSGKTLADALKVAFVKGGVDGSKSREEMVASITTWGELKSFVQAGQMEPNQADDVYGVVIWWEPGANDNDFNMNNSNKGTELSIDLGVTLFATQQTSEKDSFDEYYDQAAPELTIAVDPTNIQAYLDGEHGDLTNVTLQLAAGDYGVLYLGRPTKFAGNDTVYTCETHAFSTEDAAAFQAHLAETGYHTTPRYATSLKNLTIQGPQVTRGAANIAGVLVSTGHAYGDVYDYVLDKDYDAGSAYYSTLTMKDIAFKNVSFTGKVDINTSDANTVYDGVTFEGCSFTTGGTASANGAALRYYNEANNGNVKNLTVNNCTFTNCFQGIYVHHVNGLTVTNNSFNTTGHNAIAIQNHAGAVDLENVVIKSNTFTDIGDRVVRFGDIGADSTIVMEYNVATNSGDDAGEAVKATSIAAGVNTDVINYNSWGGTVVNPELQDKKIGTIVKDAASFKAAAEDDDDADIILVDKLAAEDLTYAIKAGATIIGTENGIISRDTANGNPLQVNTTDKVVFESVKFESVKGSAVLATRTDGANIEVNNSTFQNYAAPSTGNTGVQVYAQNVTMTFNNCTFNNMPVITASSYPEGIKLVFNDCTFNWEGDNCSGFIQIANNLKINVDLNNCVMNYTTSSQYTTAKNMISYNWPDACTININGLKVVGTRNNDKIWKICSSNNKVTVNATGELSYIFNDEAIDFNTYLK